MEEVQPPVLHAVPMSADLWLSATAAVYTPHLLCPTWPSPVLSSAQQSSGASDCQEQTSELNATLPGPQQWFRCLSQVFLVFFAFGSWEGLQSFSSVADLNPTLTLIQRTLFSSPEAFWLCPSWYKVFAFPEAIRMSGKAFRKAGFVLVSCTGL